MTSWKTYKLGELVKVKGGKRLPKGISLQIAPNTHPYIRIRDMGKSRVLELDATYEYVDDVTQKSIARYVVDEGDILLSIVGTIGLVGIVGKSLHQANQTENCVKLVNLNGIDPLFLYYFLLSPKGQEEIKRGTVGAVQAKLPIKNIENIEISLPSLEEQRRIAGILGAIDDKIENNRRINTNLELQAQALYKQWFVDFEFPNEEGKPYKSSGGRMVDSELGQIPEWWRVQTISDISVRIASGGTPKSLNESYYNGEIKWFTTKELKDCFLIDSDKHISTEALNDSAAKLFPKNTILMAIYAAPTVGRLGILTAESTFNQAAVGIVAKEEIGHLFVYLTLLAERENLNNLASGAAQQNLNVGIVKQYKLIVPTKKLLIEFNQIAGSLFERIKVVSNENKTLATLRDTLLPKLMNGEIITK